jgi:hypothetical protein
MPGIKGKGLSTDAGRMWTQQVRVITQQNYNRLVAAL